MISHPPERPTAADGTQATVMVQRELLPVLLGPGPMVIVAAQEESTAANLLSRSTSNTRSGFDLLVFQQAMGEQRAGFRRVDGRMGDTAVPLTVPPSGPCILVAATPAGRDAFGELRDWWAARAPSTVPEVTMLARPGPALAEQSTWREEIHRRLAEFALEEARTSARREVDLSAQLYELRVEYERARTALASMQELVERLGRPPWHLSFLLTPTTGRFAPSTSGGEELRQPLPFAAESLAAVDLHSPPDTVALPSDGFLAVDLASRETDATLGRWLVPYRLLRRGWVRCTLESTLADPRADLVVRWITAEGEPPPLSLAETGDCPESSARCGESPIGKALAMLLWGGVPGSKTSGHGGVWVENVDQAGLIASFEYVLGPQDFARIGMTTRCTWKYSHPLPETGGFRLHPLEGVVAGAVLPSACLPGTDRIVATVTISNSRAGFPVEYAMCVRCPADGLVMFPDDPTRDRAVEGFSGWTLVPVDSEPHVLIVDLPRPLPRSADLLFATRLPEGASIAYEWADWLEVRLRLRLPSP